MDDAGDTDDLGPRRAFSAAYHRVRLWIRRHGAWPAERDVRPCDRVAFECLYARERP